MKKGPQKLGVQLYLTCTEGRVCEKKVVKNFNEMINILEVRN